jgi:hypothetical protein
MLSNFQTLLLLLQICNKKSPQNDSDETQTINSAMSEILAVNTHNEVNIAQQMVKE